MHESVQAAAKHGRCPPPPGDRHFKTADRSVQQAEKRPLRLTAASRDSALWHSPPMLASAVESPRLRSFTDQHDSCVLALGLSISVVHRQPFHKQKNLLENTSAK